jgi:hypothetical protein
MMATWDFTCLENTLLGRSVVHHALDDIGLFEFIFKGLELARGHLGYDSVLTEGI